MKRKTKLLSIVALLLMAVTQGAWADKEVTIATNVEGQQTYTSGDVTIMFTNEDVEEGYGGWILYDDTYPMTINVNGGVIKSVVLRLSYFAENAESVHTSGNVGTRSISEKTGEGWNENEDPDNPDDDFIAVWEDGNTWVTFSGINASSVRIYADGWVQINEVKVTYADVVNVTGVSLSQTEAMLFTGGTVTLTPTVAPSNATYQSVTWSTDNASVATVSNGVVTAVGAGNANITATTTDGGKTATCAVNVMDYSAMSAYVGKVIAADGKMYKTVASANKVSTASGIVAYFGSTVETGQAYQGLAVSLTDLRYNPDYMIYCGHSGSCSGSTYGNLATALTVKNGIATNATALTTNADHGYSHQVTFAAIGNSSPRPAGASDWTVPSIGQWNLMMKGLTGNSSNLSTSANAAFSLSNVNAKLPADATGFSQTLYWSNTEKDNTNMWMMQFNGTGGYAGTTAKNTGAVTYCRAMFAFTSATSAYAVDYDANGGTGAPTAQSKDHGSSLTLSSTMPTLEGHTFIGWNTQADGSGTSYAAGAEYTIDDDVTLYAQWTVGQIAYADGTEYTRTEDLWVGAATYRKTLDADRVGKYQAWLVPFDYTLTADDLEKFTFYKINMIANSPDPETEATDKMWVFVKKLQAGDVLHGNMPYVYKPLEAVTDYEFTTDGATLKAKNTGVLMKTETAEDVYSFYASYANTTATAEAPFYYVANDGTICYGDNVTLGSMRWFIRKTNKYGDTPSYARRMHFFDGESSEATGISTAKTAIETTGEWYTLDGRRIAGKPAKSGIYVNGGRKVVIK